jgi:heme-degrading monooxygenase HmoA
MFVLHVLIEMKPDSVSTAERVFSGPFRSAISAQPGFRDVQFLRSLDGGGYVLSIAFEDQARQQQWAASKLHDEVWSEMEKNFAGYNLAKFTAV